MRGFQQLLTLIGMYQGSKTLFGETISAIVNLKDATYCDFQISGDFALDCKDEVYSVSGNEIVLRDISIAGDCAHDALSDNNIKLQDIVYDDALDVITVSVKYSVANIDIDLFKVNNEAFV
jgi:hypothetical protein